MSGEKSGVTATLETVRQGEVPTHVAVIMDGNGRWARQRGLPRWEGHRAGMAAVRETIEGAAEAGVAHLTMYAFSDENWFRPPVEVEALMLLLEEYVRSQREALVRHGIRVTVFGDRLRLPEEARQAIRELEASTEGGTALEVHLAISYGARAELAGVAQALAQRCLEGELAPEEINAELFEAELLTSDWPDPDLLIRTSGEQRISNFLLWQLAYAELFVTDVLWPDFTREHLYGALVDYRRRERRFGLVKA
ncbi:polyprenyl diphosphate synthase [Candidatus Palauibacter sp.]|uniref:polyprenyl diphosphate synthase n=1 Tax=Candidatus Palauibacter sp. TaxID=3101350 RepID=UPI003B52BE0D